MVKRSIFLLITLFLISCGSSPDSIRPKKTTLVESVYASVLVQPDSLYQVYSSVAGILDKQFISEGDKISKGSALFQIFNKSPELNRENAKINLQQARDEYSGGGAILDGLLKEIQTAQLKLHNDSINYKRQERLWKQGIGAEADYEMKKLNYESSSNSIKVLQNSYNRTKKELENRLKQARNTYKSAVVNTGDFTITSKINGSVYAVYKEIGEITTTLEPLASVGSSSEFLIELLVDEVDIVRIKKNQNVILKLDAYPELVFEGKIDKIYPKKDQRSQTFKVEAIFVNAPDVLYPGLAGEANVIISEKENTLTIPLEYLMNENMVNTEDGPVSVTIGSKNIKEVEILSGIDENTEIIKPEE